MSKEINNLQLNIKVADKMVNQLSLLDGSGYDRMGEYAQGFLMDIADKGEIGYAHLEDYFGFFNEVFHSVEWINPVVQDKGRGWLTAVEAYKTVRTVDNAQTLINF